MMEKKRCPPAESSGLLRLLRRKSQNLSDGYRKTLRNTQAQVVFLREKTQILGDVNITKVIHAFQTLQLTSL